MIHLCVTRQRRRCTMTVSVQQKPRGCSTMLAWLVLFPWICVLRCFLHGWLSIRDRCKKDKDFNAAGDKIWEAYEASDRRTFGQRLRRLREWASKTLKGILQ